MNSTSSTPKKKPIFGMNIGSSSIMLIFVILCLISFAVLSIVSAHADSKLTQKVLARTTAYYEACNSAEAALAGVDSTLQNIYASTANEEEYFKTVGHNKSYAIPISDLQTLQVTIEILYPANDDDLFYRITNWQVITSDASDSTTTIME